VLALPGVTALPELVAVAADEGAAVAEPDGTGIAPVVAVDATVPTAVVPLEPPIVQPVMSRASNTTATIAGARRRWDEDMWHFSLRNCRWDGQRMRLGHARSASVRMDDLCSVRPPDVSEQAVRGRFVSIVEERGGDRVWTSIMLP
jgi:hypothetical protein